MIFKFYNSSDYQFRKHLKNILGFKPQDVFLYKQVFQHKSISLTDSNERLEFLGDAVLSSVVAEYLYSIFPQKAEGFLTQMRAKIVNKDQLNNLAVELGIDKLIKANLNKSEIYHSITGNALEALIGAIYLDKGYKTVSKFIINRLIKKYIDLEELKDKVINYKSVLIEYVQKERKNLKFILAEEILGNKIRTYKIHVLIDDIIMGEATNISKKKAESKAAEIAFKKITTLEN